MAETDQITMLRSSRMAVGGITRSSSSRVVRPSRSLATASVAIEYVFFRAEAAITSNGASWLMRRTSSGPGVHSSVMATRRL